MKKTVFGQGYGFFQLIKDLVVTSTWGKGAGLKWTSTENNPIQNPIDYYKVVANGIHLDSIQSESLTSGELYFTTTINLSPETYYEIYLVPVDIYGNQGYKSNVVTTTTPSWQPFLFDNFNIQGVYALKRLTAGAIYAARIKRMNDNAEVDLQLPTSGFITTNSIVTGGQTLSNWAGLNQVRIIVIYDQKGSNHLTNDPLVGYAILMDGGILNTLDSMPVIRIQSSYRVFGNSKYTFGIEGFEGSAAGVPANKVSVFTLYKNEKSPLTSSDVDLAVLGEANVQSSTKSKFGQKSDNTQRFWGAMLSGQLPVITKNLRSDFMDVITTEHFGYINGQSNIRGKITLNIKKNWYGLNFTNNDGTDQVMLFNGISTNNLVDARRLIESELNKEFNNYVILQ